jgi:hypothetical protein
MDRVPSFPETEKLASVRERAEGWTCLDILGRNPPPPPGLDRDDPETECGNAEDVGVVGAMVGATVGNRIW